MNGPFDFSANPDLRRLKALLFERGYSRQNLAKTGGLPMKGRELDTAELRVRTREASPFNTLARVFLLGMDVEPAALQEALPGVDLEALARFGLLHRSQGGLRAECAIVPFEDWLFFRDFEPAVTGKPLRGDHVLGVGVASTLLSSLTVRKPTALALDIGVGQGFQSLSAAAHCGRVIGTDVNERCLAFTKAAALANEIGNVEVRAGSLFEPVRESAGKVGLLVSNPPFVISPPHDVVGLGGAYQGDELVEQLVRGVPTMLAEGGYATVLMNWHHAESEDWPRRPLNWAAGRGCDAWLIKWATDPGRVYARRWLAEKSPDGAAVPQETLDSWLSYYDRLGAAYISFGALILRRRQGSTWQRADTVNLDQLRGSGGTQMCRIFDGHTLATQGQDAEVLNAPLRLTDRHELSVKQIATTLSSGQRAWGTTSAVLRQTDGLDMPVGVDGPSLHLLPTLDGTTTLKARVLELARRLDAPPEVALVQSATLARRMLSLGFFEM